MPTPVSTWMGDRLQMGKPSCYVTSRSCQLSLAIPLWVSAMSTRESWDVNRHTARCISQMSMVWQWKLFWLRSNEMETNAALWAL